MQAARAALQSSMGSGGGGGPASSLIGIIAGAGAVGLAGKLHSEHTQRSEKEVSASETFVRSSLLLSLSIYLSIYLSCFLPPPPIKILNDVAICFSSNLLLIYCSLGILCQCIYIHDRL